MSNIKSTGQMENCFQLIIFIFIIFLDSERKVRYVFLIEMTQFTAVFVFVVRMALHLLLSIYILVSLGASGVWKQY